MQGSSLPYGNSPYGTSAPGLYGSPNTYGTYGSSSFMNRSPYTSTGLYGGGGLGSGLYGSSGLYGPGGMYGGGMYGGAGGGMYGGAGGLYGSSPLYGGPPGATMLGGPGMLGGAPYDPALGPPPAPPSAWQTLLAGLNGIMHFFGRLSFLVDENAHAVHFFISALLQVHSFRSVRMCRLLHVCTHVLNNVWHQLS